MQKSKYGNVNHDWIWWETKYALFYNSIEGKTFWQLEESLGKWRFTPTSVKIILIELPSSQTQDVLNMLLFNILFIIPFINFS